MIAKRFAFATHILATGHAQVYYYNKIIWADTCNSMLPRTEGKASEQALARKGKHGWLSLGNELASPNLRGAKESEKQASWGTSKVWWAPVLARGKLHIEVFDDEYLGENRDGAEILVSKVRATINKRFQGGTSKPDAFWTDRGKGFYSLASGEITVAYQESLREHRFKAALGNDARVQPGRLQELMLHETAVSWIRLRLTRSVPTWPWEETVDAYAARLKGICDEINNTLDVEGLRRGFLKRVQDFPDCEGGRWAK